MINLKLFVSKFSRQLVSTLIDTYLGNFGLSDWLLADEPSKNNFSS
jgi:hypothetical protein